MVCISRLRFIFGRNIIDMDIIGEISFDGLNVGV